MELGEQLLLLSFQVLILLEFHFVFPLQCLVLRRRLGNPLLALYQIAFHFIVSDLFLKKSVDFFANLLKWAYNQLAVVFLDKPFLLSLCVFGLLLLEIPSEGSNQVEICLGDGGVVFLNVKILLLVLVLQLSNRDVLLVFDLLALNLPLVVHLFSKESHLFLVFALDLVRDALILLANVSLFCAICLCQCVQVLLVPGFLLFLLHLQSSEILLQFSFVYSVLVFRILELDLRFLLDLSLLVHILEHQVLQTLSPYFDSDGVFLFQILVLSVLVPQFCLLIFEFFLSHEPEVVDSETLIIVQTSQVFFSLY